MEWITVILSLLAGLILRLAIPIVVTLLVVYILRQVDIRWQEEADQTPMPVIVEKPHCWEIKGCSPEKMSECPSASSVEPCWQVRRLPNGYLREECLTCQVFHQAPIPIPNPS